MKNVLLSVWREIQLTCLNNECNFLYIYFPFFYLFSSLHPEKSQANAASVEEKIENFKMLILRLNWDNGQKLPKTNHQRVVQEGIETTKVICNRQKVPFS